MIIHIEREYNGLKSLENVHVIAIEKLKHTQSLLYTMLLELISNQYSKWVINARAFTTTITFKISLKFVCNKK